MYKNVAEAASNVVYAEFRTGHKETGHKEYDSHLARTSIAAADRLQAASNALVLQVEDNEGKIARVQAGVETLKERVASLQPVFSKFFSELHAF